jgi:hypothetical protein
MRARLLLQRVVRLDAALRSVLEARVIVSASPAEAEAVAAKVRAGADFALVALQDSKDPSSRAGGTLPPLVRGDLAWPDVEARLFAAPAGSLVGPLEVAGGGRRTWHLYRVLRRTEPWAADAGGWSPRLEADLARRPVDRAEYEAWRRRVFRERDVRLLAPDGTAFVGGGR